MLTRAESFGVELRHRPFDLVLCHGDIHAANILVDRQGEIWLIDWDGPLIAPRERDLLFVVGSRIARVVTPDEEDRFFERYGATEIDPAALIYFRYERLIQDIGEFGMSVLFDPALSEAARAEAIELTSGFFAPGGDLDTVENVSRMRWP
jgi:spectinomycin phosphotransferase